MKTSCFSPSPPSLLLFFSQLPRFLASQLLSFREDIPLVGDAKRSEEAEKLRSEEKKKKKKCPAAGRWLLDILSLKNYNDHRMLKMKIEKKVKELIKQIHSELEKKFKKKLAKIILFGSYARGDYDKESDLDILVLIEEENPQKYRSEIVDLEVDLTIKYGILPSLILRNTGYFLENKDIIPFFKHVEKEGVEIYAA